MRRALVLFVLLGLMLGMKALKTDPPGASDPLTLAAIGFVVLASFTIAQIGSAMSLPRVTGYILGGAVLGPHVSNILSESVVDEMTMFNNLALGLIATGAGLELDAKQIARIWRTLLSTVAVKIVLGVVVVGGTLYGAQSYLGSLDVETGKPLIALSLLLGVLSIGTSPAIALAIINESRAKGRFSDLVLGAAVLKDLVVVVCLAIAIAVAGSLVHSGAAEAAAGGAHGGGNPMLLVAWELGGSLLIGSVLGVILIIYLRFVHAEMLLVVAAMILVMAEVAHALHLELLLVFITAGFVVRNFSKYEHELLHAVELVALPVYVVFFTIAGAKVDLGLTWQVLPIALALCVARAVVYIVASRVGARVGGESSVVRNQAWLAYLPQAGVTLGLVGLAAKRVPELAAAIMSTGTAFVAVNLLVGPITLRGALNAAGEAGAASARDEEIELPPASTEELHVAPTEAPAKLEAALDEIDSEPLREHIERLYGKLDAAGLNYRNGVLQQWTDDLRAKADQFLGEDIETEQEWDCDSEHKAKTLRTLLQRMHSAIADLPEEITVPLGEHNRVRQRDDTTAVALQKTLLRTQLKLRFKKDQRKVPLQACAQATLAPRLSSLIVDRMSSWTQAELAVLAKLEAAALGSIEPEAARSEIDEELGHIWNRFDRELHKAFHEGFEELTKLLLEAGGPTLPATQVLQDARSETSVRRTLEQLETSPAEWERVVDLAQAEVRFTQQVLRLREIYETALQRSVIDPAAQALVGVERVLSLVEKNLGQVRSEVDEGADESNDALRLEQRTRVRAAFDEDELAELEASAARFRASASMHPVALELRAAIEVLPEDIEIPRRQLSLEERLDPAKVKARSFEFRQEARDVLLRELLPSSDHRLRQVAETVVNTATRLREAQEIALSVLDEGESNAATVAQLDRAVARLSAQRKELERDLIAAREGLVELADACFDQLIERSGVAEPAARGGGSWIIDRAVGLVRPVTRGYRTLRSGLVSLYRTAIGSQLGRDVRARYGELGFDATTIREYAARWKPSPELPADYMRLFAANPVTEHRLFTTNRGALDAVLSTERNWLEGKPGGVLVVGEHGSGRTSILNLMELELRAPRVIRPEPLEWRRAVGVRSALAIELGCRENISFVRRALAAQRTTILLDDLEQWLDPSPEGLQSLTELLDLIVRTQKHANWVVSIERHALSLLEENVPLRLAFARIVDLNPLSTKELAAAILDRHRLSNRVVSYPTSFVTRVLARLQRSSDEQVFFGLLARASGGNIGRAIAFWTQGAEVLPTGALRPHIDITLTLGLPFIPRLAPAEIATLVQLLRYGPLTEREISGSLQLGKTEVTRLVHHLLSAGLLERSPQVGRPLSIPRTIRGAVMQTLDQMGARR